MDSNTIIVINIISKKEQQGKNTITLDKESFVPSC